VNGAAVPVIAWDPVVRIRDAGPRLGIATLVVRASVAVFGARLRGSGAADGGLAEIVDRAGIAVLARRRIRQVQAQASTGITAVIGARIVIVTILLGTGDALATGVTMIADRTRIQIVAGADYWLENANVGARIALVGGAILPVVTKSLVGVAVAVVIRAIAAFDLGRPGVAIDNHSVLAVAGPGARTLQIRLGTRELALQLVGQPVAVVVDVVAFLRTRLAGIANSQAAQKALAQSHAQSPTISNLEAFRLKTHRDGPRRTLALPIFYRDALA
jgi:hypothetical protein